jgi:hypothetical protein
MATRKVSLTLDDKLVREAKRRSRSTGLSSYVNDALRLQLQQDRLGGLLADLDDEFGPAPEELRAEVEREWRQMRAAKARRKRA